MKNTFAPKTFAARTFACGALAGVSTAAGTTSRGSGGSPSSRQWDDDGQWTRYGKDALLTPEQWRQKQEDRKKPAPSEAIKVVVATGDVVLSADYFGVASASPPVFLANGFLDLFSSYGGAAKATVPFFVASAKNFVNISISGRAKVTLGSKAALRAIEKAKLDAQIEFDDEVFLGIR